MSDQENRQRLAELSPEQRLALYERLQKRKIEQPQARDVVPPLTRSSRESHRFPLSFAQQRLWFLEQFEPGTALYNIPLALRIRGPLQPALLVRALTTLVARHEPLRTTFTTASEEPVQVIEAPGALHIPFVDLHPLPQQEREALSLHLAHEEAQKPFNLSCEPPLRTTLLRLGEHEHILLLTMHHIATDGWSQSIFLRELTMLYQAYLRGQPSPLPALPIQYVDFARWQRQWLQGEVLQEQLTYWKRQLAGLPSLLLPTDQTRPTIRTTHGALLSRSLSRDLFTRLTLLARREGVSLFMLLLAAFAILLSRYTGVEDVTVGTAIANRNRQEIEGLIGFFVNTLALRCDLSGNPSFHVLLQRVREVCLEAYAHQDLPFERLVEELQPERDLSISPLVQVQLLVQNTPQASLALQDLEVQPMLVSTRTAKFDVTLSLLENAQAAFLEVEYNKDLFEEATIGRMLGHFERLLRAIVDDTAQAISALPMLTAQELQQILVEWNATQTDAPREVCIHHLIEAQVARTPQALAVVYGEQAQTYQEMDQYANRLAHYLCALGVAPEIRVGVCLEHILEVPAALLGILKAGGAYVPLDPSYPGERLAFMLADAQVSVLLTQQSLLARLPGTTARVIALDSEASVLALYPDTMPPQVSVAAENLAYMLYTSGSTGRPKGVMIPHQGLMHYIHWSSHYYQVAQGNGAPLHSSLSFDLTITSLFLPLLVGRPVTLVRAGQGGEELGSLLRQHPDFSLVKVTPAHLAMLSQQLPEHDLAQVSRVLVVGGEALHAESLALWRTHAPHTRIINEYGPTETVVGCCIYELTDDSASSGHVPIGHPIANTRLYVLNARLQPVPVGVVGELYIGGAGVARGYYRRPDLTAERFIPDPFSTQPGARLYRTGDLARYRADGILEFLGRNDQQVKIRGYRIELAEVEAALQRHPMVKEALVLPWEDQPQDGSLQTTRLLAYVVAQEEQRAISSGLSEEEAARVSFWQRTFDRHYSENSTNNRSLIQEQMSEEIDATVARIRSLQPKRVLEIGCGAGLLLLRLAPSCDTYWGLDLSSPALETLQRQVDRRGIGNVRLLQKGAHTIRECLAEQEAAFDVIVLDSVIQYFPSIDYLVRVLEDAVRLLAPGGHIYVGGVRHLGTLHASHASTQLHQAPFLLLTEQLLQRIQQQMSHDPELAIDPAFFSALQRHLPRIKQTELLLKRGHTHNELTRFRYDAMLHLTHHTSTASDSVRVLNWEQASCSLSWLQQCLREQQPSVLEVNAIPNARLTVETTLLEVLADENRPPRVGAIWDEVRKRSAQKTALDPEDIWKLGEVLPYAVSISCSKMGEIQCFDARFVRRGEEPDGNDAPAISLSRDEALQELSWQVSANHPYTVVETEDPALDLRGYLKQHLPEYMLPAAIVVIDALPLTPNGKVDRKKLPPPDMGRSTLKSAFVAARTSTEKALAQIWSQVLGIEQVGIHDNFFELGGDSLLTIRIVARANQAGLRITTKHLFQHQTIAALASVAGTKPTLAEQGLVTGRQSFMPAHRNNLWPGMGDPGCHSMAYILEDLEPLHPAHVEAVVRHILFYHDALRLQAIKQGMDWQLLIAGMPETLPYQIIDLSRLSEVEQKSTLVALAMKLVLHFNLAQGPLFRLAFCYLGPHQPTPLIVVGHSLVVDMQSWQILLDDIRTACRQMSTQGTIAFPPKTTSYRQWGELLLQYAQSTILREELPYWLADARKHISPLPMDYPGGANTGASMDLIIALFTPEESQLLQQEIARVDGLQIDTFLLAAVAEAFREWTGKNSQLISIEIHGREPLFDDVNLSRTIGTFPMDFPLLIELEHATTPGEILRAVNRYVHNVPQRGIGYGILRYMNQDSAVVEQIKALPQVEIHFNYLGTFLVPEVEDIKVSGPYNGRIATAHLIERQWVSFLITSSIVDDTLQMMWIYSSNQYQQETVKHVAREAKQKVKDFLLYLQACEDGTRFL